MVSRSDGYLVLYPVYFDARASRSQGRRVAASSAATGLTAKELYEAARAAGLEPVLEDEHPHPAKWFEKGGRILVPEKVGGSKREAIEAVAQHLPSVVEARSGKPKPKGDRVRGGKKKRHRRRN
jgi:signal recognition particle subunit SRP19